MKKKKMSTKLLVIIFTISMTILIAIMLGQKEETKQIEEETKVELNQEISKMNLIDMNNTENVEIKDNVKTNISSKIKEVRECIDLQVKDVTITATNGISNFTAVVENNLEEQRKSEEILIIFFRKDGSEIARIKSYIPEIEPSGEGRIIADTDEDIANAYDFKIEK